MERKRSFLPKFELLCEAFFLNGLKDRGIDIIKWNIERQTNIQLTKLNDTSEVLPSYFIPSIVV